MTAGRLRTLSYPRREVMLWSPYSAGAGVVFLVVLSVAIENSFFVLCMGRLAGANRIL